MRTIHTLADHAEACAKVGVVPDSTAYRKGRDQGISEYCTPENAQREGRLGRSYRNACPAHLERRFLRASFESFNLSIGI